MKDIQEGMNFGKSLFGSEGLDPQKRAALQSEANRHINREQYASERKLLGEQSQRGIGGNSGIAYQQRRDLERNGQDLKYGVNRDLDKIDSDLALKQLAANFNVGQGEAIQSQLDRQLALDELGLEDERRKQRAYENTRARSFSRV
jgi:hypothetical protein